MAKEDMNRITAPISRKDICTSLAIFLVDLDMLHVIYDLHSLIALDIPTIHKIDRQANRKCNSIGFS
ncbi:MAG: hypothetical protein WA323_23995 [Candidatus Nitrosopolaris sp.]